MRFATPLRRLLLGCLATWTIAQGMTHAQEPTPDILPVFRSTVDLVTIQATVKDTHGRRLSNLTATDFEVRDNGIPRPIVTLRSDTNSPVSVAILVDMSGSMQVSSKMSLARDVLATIVSQLRPGEDEAALYTFDATLHEQTPFTTDVARLKDALPSTPPFGTTSLYDVTATAAKQIAGRAGTRKAIIVLTDGIDTSSMLTAPEVSGLASSIDVPVFVVATVPTIDARTILESAPRTSGADLRDLADWTGGQLNFASTLIESGGVARALLNDIRQQYVLVIEAATVAEWRRLDVRVPRRQAVVKARSGYFGS